jgi:hypothetical protein
LPEAASLKKLAAFILPEPPVYAGYPILPMLSFNHLSNYGYGPFQPSTVA